MEARLRAEFSYLVLAARIRNQTLDIWVRMWLLTSTKAKKFELSTELSDSSSLTTFIIYYFTFSQSILTL